MMVDPAGNLYYDTGEQKLGFYMVRHPISPMHMLREGSATCLDKYAGQNEQKRVSLEYLQLLKLSYCSPNDQSSQSPSQLWPTAKREVHE